MSLNKASGNMYDFIDFTWNTIKGECPHGCSYCYMHRWGKQKPVHFDEKELKTDLGSGNFIFVGSSCDMWAKEIPSDWICKTLDKCDEHNNQYLFQTKNPGRFINHEIRIPEDSILCTTIETNRPLTIEQAPSPRERAVEIGYFRRGTSFRIFITIEPIMDFDLRIFCEMIKGIRAEQVNIGADSGNNHLPEPSKDKVLALIAELSKFTKVVQKPNLQRLLK